MVEVFFFFFGNISGILLLYFFVIRPGQKTDGVFEKLRKVNTDFTDAIVREHEARRGVIYVPSAEGKRASYEGVNSQEELDETLALARQILEAQRKRVRDNNLGTPEDLGFDTPTERL